MTTKQSEKPRKAKLKSGLSKSASDEPKKGYSTKFICAMTFLLIIGMIN